MFFYPGLVSRCGFLGYYVRDLDVDAEYGAVKNYLVQILRVYCWILIFVQDLDETILERIAALSEMFPQWMQTGTSKLLSGSLSTIKGELNQIPMRSGLIHLVFVS